MTRALLLALALLSATAEAQFLPDGVQERSLAKRPTFQFNAFTVGSYASPVSTDVGSPQLTVSRASAGSFTNASALINSAPANALRVGTQGFLVEPASQNFVTDPSAICAHNTGGGGTCTANTTLSPDGTVDAAHISINASGATYIQNITPGGGTLAGRTFTLSVYCKASTAPGTIYTGITDTQAWAVGQASQTACSVTTGTYSRCSTTVTYYGGDTSTLAGLLVAMTVGQLGNPNLPAIDVDCEGVDLEEQPFPTTFVTGSRSLETVTTNTAGVVGGALGGFSFGFVPEWSSTAAGVDRPLLSTTGLSLTYSASGHTLSLAAGGATATSAALTFNAGTSHVVQGRWSNGSPACLAVDGSETCAGTVTTFTPAATVYLGGSSMVASGAAVYGLHFCGTYAQCRAPSAASHPSQRVLWLSDSIYNGVQNTTALAAALPNVALTQDTATYGGTVAGLGLLELADKTDAYLAGSWQTQTRGVPFSNYNALIFEYMRNDANLSEPLAAYTNAYDKILAQAQRLFPAIVAGNSPPQALANLSAWDPTNDNALNGGYRNAVPPLISKWNAPFADTFSLFLASAPGTYTVAQIMRDQYHPTVDTGTTLMVNNIGALLTNPKTLSAASPAIAGRVVNQLFGQPTGTWSMQSLASTTGPTQSPLYRIAGLPDEGQVSSTIGDKVVFPSVTTNAGGQVWGAFFIDSATGGTCTVYVDKGTGSQVSVSVNNLNSGVTNYPRSFLIADGLSAGPHTVEIDVTSAAPVRVLGITWVGAQ